MLDEVISIQNKYEEILHSEEEDDIKSLLFGKLMTDMEMFYHIPIFSDEGWEKKNKTKQFWLYYGKFLRLETSIKSVFHFREVENAFRCIPA
ncbi:hypothetical protein [Alkalihalophilus pseudofirmus]|nr:hypothetical protein [Alkalihalophilus pseudofirmus]